MPKDPALQTISINIPKTLAARIKRLAFHQDISVSSVIEKSLQAFLEQGTEENLGVRLRELGATLRRP